MPSSAVQVRTGRPLPFFLLKRMGRGSRQESPFLCMGLVFPTGWESCSQGLGVLFPVPGNPVPDPPAVAAGAVSCSG
ncbi:hypothetical protein HMPREF9141_0791 [Prevotella multiformis DSM 16608]|uniref:Uncharacterized protein n=1 Tax=Prevotella multiformis DSM 16608 TaxID=888743 RepID=F0F5C5_9BACT|nr:hypothetical protein HMPREF9141_0791 [Prevotella multiformis DSM 16608]